MAARGETLPRPLSFDGSGRRLVCRCSVSFEPRLRREEDEAHDHDAQNVPLPGRTLVIPIDNVLHLYRFPA